MSGALEYRFVTSEINPSILESRLRAFFVFMNTPFSYGDCGDHCRPSERQSSVMIFIAASPSGSLRKRAERHSNDCLKCRSGREKSQSGLLPPTLVRDRKSTRLNSSHLG